MLTVDLMIPIAGVFTGLASILYALYLGRWVLKQDPGDEKMRFISDSISAGARAYLNRQFKTIAGILVVLFIIIALGISWAAAASFVAGALGSMMAGYLGMYVTTRSASRAAQAARRGVRESLKISWRAGATMGLTLAGVALLIISSLYILYSRTIGDWTIPLIATGFGASLVTLFMRVGGGIYTKAADLGADLVGKIEVGIPEDDPRNPGVIADNVGDNVGDVAGMAADVFESYVVTVTAAMFLAGVLGLGLVYVEIPLLYSLLLLLASVVGVLILRLRDERNPLTAIRGSIVITAVLGIILIIITSMLLFSYDIVRGLSLALTASLGIILAPIILWITEYYTTYTYKPVRKIAEQARISPATVIVSGYAIGLSSAVPTLIAVSLALGLSYLIGYQALSELVSEVFGVYRGLVAGVYGTAIASVGLLSMAGIIITADSFGPVSDNANGVVEMAGLPDEVREVTEVLDMVGNTTKASTKGYAIASAALASLVLFMALIFEIVKILGVNSIPSILSSLTIINPNLLIGAFIGVMIVYIFSSRTLEAVGRTAMEVVEEIRRQFREKPGILEWREKPDYERVVDITTRRALEEFLKPGLIALATPIVVGIVLGWQSLAGVILGAVIAGVPRALLMANAGGAWDNAKKYIELSGGKGSEAHKAAVVGDTVGDPFKDTTGPSINPLIKVLNTLSVVFASLIIYMNTLLGIDVFTGLLKITFLISSLLSHLPFHL
ncbi:MAG: sodium-translocating pyrophosphatase [Sulfolobales archaeon]